MVSLSHNSCHPLLDQRHAVLCACMMVTCDLTVLTRGMFPSDRQLARWGRVKVSNNHVEEFLVIEYYKL